MSTICLSFDFDALSVWLEYGGNFTPNMLQRGEFGARVGVPRILELLKRYQLPATFFVPGHTADSFPAETAAILEAGHQVAHTTHAPPALLHNSAPT
nr:polysaccharide deacetylase family protein [Anaerolineae bacterium]